ncbi:hypothetical protein C8R45DRAFT_899656, partial [Mycena sanguinolenta]
MDPVLLQSIVAALQNVVTSRYVSVAGYVVLLYDHMLTLDDEMEYIWGAKNTVAKVLFLIQRYMVPLFITGQTITRSGLPVIPMSDVVCKIWNSITTYAGWFSIGISNFLVLLRIWTTLPPGHHLVVWSLWFFIVMQLVGLGVTTWVIRNIIPVFYFDPVLGFCSFTSKPSVAGLWIPGLIFEATVFVTVWWNALDRPRALGTDSNDDITRMLVRDGVTYFVILFVLRIINTILAFVAPVSLIFVGVYFIWAATTVTTSRLIINSRREDGTEERQRQMAEGESNAEIQSTDRSKPSRSGSSSHWSKSGTFGA